MIYTPWSTPFNPLKVTTELPKQTNHPLCPWCLSGCPCDLKPHQYENPTTGGPEVSSNTHGTHRSCHVIQLGWPWSYWVDTTVAPYGHPTSPISNGIIVTTYQYCGVKPTNEYGLTCEPLILPLTEFDDRIMDLQDVPKKRALSICGDIVRRRRSAGEGNLICLVLALGNSNVSSGCPKNQQSSHPSIYVEHLNYLIPVWWRDVPSQKFYVLLPECKLIASNVSRSPMCTDDTKSGTCLDGYRRVTQIYPQQSCYWLQRYVYVCILLVHCS